MPDSNNNIKRAKRALKSKRKRAAAQHQKQSDRTVRNIVRTYVAQREGAQQAETRALLRAIAADEEATS